MILDFDANMVNYKGKEADDYSLQLAAGPEFHLNQADSLTLQGVGLMRWYGGKVASRQVGAKVTYRHDIRKSDRIGFQFEGRYNGSDFGDGYTGLQFAAAGTYEHIIGKSEIASLAVYGRRELMQLDAYSNKTIGVNLGIGGELPLGINAGLSGGVGYTRYDAPPATLLAKNLTAEDRHDLRLNARIYAGLRKVRVMGFSPSIEYQFQQASGNFALYESTRHRFQFKLAHYF